DFVILERLYELTAFDLVSEHSQIADNNALAQHGGSVCHVAAWKQFTLFPINSLNLVCLQPDFPIVTIWRRMQKIVNRKISRLRQGGSIDEHLRSAYGGHDGLKH